MIDSLELLQEVTDTYDSQPFADRRHIRVDENAQRIVFTSDKTLLQRVIGNMLKNALEASGSGDTVTLGCEMRGDRIEFRVHNPNPMPREIQLQVFQCSFSTKGPGRGIGTYSMKLLSERYLQGNVSFTSSAEAGTVFRARYPLSLND